VLRAPGSTLRAGQKVEFAAAPGTAASMPATAKP
jgi:hypothetical protein